MKPFALPIPGAVLFFGIAPPRVPSRHPVKRFPEHSLRPLYCSSDGERDCRSSSAVDQSFQVRSSRLNQFPWQSFVIRPRSYPCSRSVA